MVWYRVIAGDLRVKDGTQLFDDRNRKFGGGDRRPSVLLKCAWKSGGGQSQKESDERV